MSIDWKNNFSSTSGKLNRRHFFQYSTVIAGGLMVSPYLAKAGIITDKSSADGAFWYQKPLRIMHTVLREIDARKYDADAVVDYLKKGGYNTLCVNAGGIVDLLRCQGNCEIKTNGQKLYLQIRKLEDFFSIHIQMAT